MSAATPDHLSQFMTLITPVVHYGAIALFLFLVLKITGQNPVEIGEKIIGQFVRLVRFDHTLKSLNALIDVLAFALIIGLFASPLRDLFIPELKNAAAYQELISQGIVSLLVVAFLLAGVACVWFCERADRP